MSFIILLFSFSIFLFTLHVLSKDDFILLRKNVSLEDIFNYAFIGALASLLSARIFYVFFHPSWRFVNPLIFLIFLYFPGLSLTGGVIGMGIFLFFLFRKKKIPRGRIYDMFSLAFMSSVVFYIVVAQIFAVIFTRHISIIDLGIALVFFLFFTTFSIVFQKDKAKDGTISILMLLLYCVSFGLSIILSTKDKKMLLFDREIIVLAGLSLFSIVLFIKQKLVRRRK